MASFFIIPLIGYYFLFKKHKQIAILTVIMTGLIFYVHSAPWDWWGGSAFGQRRVADISPFLILGLVAILERVSLPKIPNIMIKSTIFGIFVFWNIIFMIIWIVDLPHAEEVDIALFPNCKNH